MTNYNLLHKHNNCLDPWNAISGHFQGNISANYSFTPGFWVSWIYFNSFLEGNGGQISDFSPWTIPVGNSFGKNQLNHLLFYWEVIIIGTPIAKKGFITRDLFPFNKAMCWTQRFSIQFVPSNAVPPVFSFRNGNLQGIGLWRNHSLKDLHL